MACEFEEMTLEEFDKTWKIISSFSERQVGAYSFIYLSYFGKAPSVLSGKFKELRNKVVHKGYIPSKDEATEYGERVLNEVVPVLLELCSRSEHRLSDYCNKYLWAVYKRIVAENPNSHVSQSDHPFIINWNRLHFEKVGDSIDLKKRLERRPKCYSVTNF